MRISKTQLLATTFIAGVAFATPSFAQSTDPQGPSQDPNVQAAPTDQTPATQENAADTAAQGVHPMLVSMLRSELVREVSDGTYLPPTFSQTIKLRRVT